MRDQVIGDGAVLNDALTSRARQRFEHETSGSLHLINAKLKPPRPPAACIPRGELLDRLTRATRRKLVLLTAPTGSGKSTLLTQWHRRYDSTRSIAWLSLDEQDHDPIRFFSYLGAALRAPLGAINAYTTDPGNQESALLDAVTCLFGEKLSAFDADLTIVIDDCQWIASSALARALDFLLRRSPANVHWILSGRCVPNVCLGSLRLNDDLTCFGARELSFDTALIQQLSRKLSRRALSNEEAESIHSRTEGWVAGVKLALLARDEPRAISDVGDTLGSQAEVAEYLGGSVLQEQSAEIRDFLLASSIVDRMTGELCNALLGISDSQRILEELERAQLFIQPLDGRRHWFRYHTLFLDFLRSRLRRDESNDVAMLHERASRWYAEHQFLDESLIHAFAARNVAWRNELLARCTAIWLQNGEIADVLRWSERLPREELLSNFAIARAYVAALILSRRFTDAADALRTLSHCTDRHSIGPQLVVLAMMYAILADSDTASIVEVDSVQVDSVDTFLAGTLLTLKAYALLRRQAFDASRRSALCARNLLEHQSAYGRGYAEIVAALADRAQGDLKGAAERCERTFAEVRHGRRSPAWVNAATPVAYTRYEENRLAEAEALCVEILPVLSVASTVETMTTTYITFARIKAASSQFDEAGRLLEHLHSVLEGGGHQRFLAQVWSEKLLLALRESAIERADTIAAEWRLESRFERGASECQHYDEAWERAGSAYAQLLLHRGECASAETLLVNLRKPTQAVGYVYRQIRIEAALACCMYRAGREAEAFTALNRALALTRGYGFTRGVFDEVPSLSELVTRALEHHMLRHTLPFHYLRKFDNLLSVRRAVVPESCRPKPSLSPPLEPLTDREIDILKLLARGLSNTEISEQSQIALSTAKWHLKNVFAKLDVNTRTGALARARALRLVD